VKLRHSARPVLSVVPAAAALAAALGLILAACGSGGTTPHVAAARQTSPSFLGQLHASAQVASTVPANGDVNPYGVAVVPASTGKLVAGDTLVSNFNSKANVQGTGTTIVQVSPSGSSRLFAHVARLPAGLSCPGGVGLTTALGILPGGWVLAGSLPTMAGGALPGVNPAGCLIVLNDQGTPVKTFTNSHIVGPWDMAVRASSTSAQVFVSNALGGNTSTKGGVPVAGKCTVVRLSLGLGGTSAPALTRTTVVGTDFPWIANKTALVLAPTGLALGRNGTLYVADTQTNSISAIPGALTRTTPVTAQTNMIMKGGALNAPLGMTMAPNGDLIVTNGNDGNAVEVSQAGKQVATKTLVKNGAGDLFGITAKGSSLLAVNDGTNALDLYRP
jgi:hypothetical protein